MYELGAFGEDGKPTAIMRAFTMANLQSVYDRPLVTLHTSVGDVTVELYNETPKHRDNFLKLAKEGGLNDKPFYRVIKDFMVQFGDAENDATIDAEITYPTHLHWRGVLAAAREGDETNPTFRSSAANFYIVWGRNAWDSMPHLDKTYTVFGEVVKGLDVIDKIQSRPAQTEPVRILNIEN